MASTSASTCLSSPQSISILEYSPYTYFLVSPCVSPASSYFVLESTSSSLLNPLYPALGLSSIPFMSPSSNPYFQSQTQSPTLTQPYHTTFTPPLIRPISIESRPAHHLVHRFPGKSSRHHYHDSHHHRRPLVYPYYLEQCIPSNFSPLNFLVHHSWSYLFYMRPHILHHDREHSGTGRLRTRAHPIVQFFISDIATVLF